MFQRQLWSYNLNKICSSLNERHRLVPSLKKKKQTKVMQFICYFDFVCLFFLFLAVCFPIQPNACNSSQVVSSVASSLVERITGDHREQKGELVLPFFEGRMTDSKPGKTLSDLLLFALQLMEPIAFL